MDTATLRVPSFFFSSRRRHTRSLRDWSSDVCSSDLGLSLTEFAVLEVLHHKGPLRLGEIRDRILLTGASTTYVVKKLEARGLMRRRACGEDSRVVFGELTAKGRALIEEVFP